MYYYDKRWWEGANDLEVAIPGREDCYEMFFNEHEINERISQSPFSSNYPRILASGYWNGLGDNPMHIFEYLGEELPEEEWDKAEVYRVIRSRLNELHSLGISHNDIRLPNIHVSVSGHIFFDRFWVIRCNQ
ncbi:uncharacterized protein RJT20DRAFT_55736 [Scheffersomyces xylosifermentans]|uniref:uncharacterized protein n=1 Tax=Scheffersomyces xylosifermentans TaxID=1304137 RepID=UPI00315D5479